MNTPIHAGLGVGLAVCLSGVLVGTRATGQTGAQPYSHQPVTGPPTYTSSYQGEVPEIERGVHPPRNAFELGLRAGYDQPFGRFSGQTGGSVANLTDAGGSVAILPSYRMTPHSSIGVLAQYAQYNSDVPDTTVRGLAGGLDFTYHILPGERADPWLSLGAGYRLLWQNPGDAPNTMLHGFQLARVNVGLDAVVSDDVAIGPYVGADLTMFLWQVGPGPDGQIQDNGRLSTFLNAGLSGRFDLGGTRDRTTTMPTYASRY